MDVCSKNFLLPHVADDEECRSVVQTRKRCRKTNSVTQTIAERRRVLYKNVGSSGASLAANVASPYQRHVSVFHTMQCFVKLIDGGSSSDSETGSTTFGNITALFRQQPAALIGTGNNATAIRTGFRGRVCVLKTAVRDEPRSDFVSSQSELKLLAMEGRIGLFVALHLLGVTCPNAARCPNFVCAYAYELTSFAPVVNEHGKIGQKFLTDSYAAIVAQELFNLGTPDCLKFSDVNASRVDISVFESEHLSFSMLAQILIALSTIAMIGVTHNDLSTSNIFARSIRSDQSLAYDFPFGTTGIGSSVVIRTGGVLFSIGDFGTASCAAWETSGDKRFQSQNLEYGRHATLGEFYFGDERQRVARNANMTCTDASGKMCHPLCIDLDTLERDVSYFLTKVIASTELDEYAQKSLRTRAYAKACLREYNLCGRLRNRYDLMTITERVLQRDFVAKHYDDDAVGQFFCSVAAPSQHVYKLPNEQDGALLESLLQKTLNEPVEADCFVKLQYFKQRE